MRRRSAPQSVYERQEPRSVRRRVEQSIDDEPEHYGRRRIRPDVDSIGDSQQSRGRSSSRSPSPLDEDESDDDYIGRRDSNDLRKEEAEDIDRMRERRSRQYTHLAKGRAKEHIGRSRSLSPFNVGYDNDKISTYSDYDNESDEETASVREELVYTGTLAERAESDGVSMTVVLKSSTKEGNDVAAGIDVNSKAGTAWKESKTSVDDIGETYIQSIYSLEYSVGETGRGKVVLFCPEGPPREDYESLVQVRWLHVERHAMSLEVLDQLILTCPFISNDMRRVAVRLLETVQQRFVRDSENGPYIKSGCVLRAIGSCPGSGDRRRGSRKGEVTHPAIFVASPQLVMKPMARTRSISGSSNEFRTQTLLHSYYSFDVVGDREKGQAVQKMSSHDHTPLSEVLHVDQTWCLLLGSNVIITISNRPIDDVGSGIIERRKSVSDRPISLRLFDTNGRLHHVVLSANISWVDLFRYIVVLCEGTLSDAMNYRLTDEDHVVVTGERWIQILNMPNLNALIWRLEERRNLARKRSSSPSSSRSSRASDRSIKRSPQLLGYHQRHATETNKTSSERRFPSSPPLVEYGYHDWDDSGGPRPPSIDDREDRHVQYGSHLDYGRRRENPWSEPRDRGYVREDASETQRLMNVGTNRPQTAMPFKNRPTVRRPPIREPRARSWSGLSSESETEVENLVNKRYFLFDENGYGVERDQTPLAPTPPLELEGEDAQDSNGKSTRKHAPFADDLSPSSPLFQNISEQDMAEKSESRIAYVEDVTDVGDISSIENDGAEDSHIAAKQNEKQSDWDSETRVDALENGMHPTDDAGDEVEARTPGASLEAGRETVTGATSDMIDDADERSTTRYFAGDREQPFRPRASTESLSQPPIRQDDMGRQWFSDRRIDEIWNRRDSERDGTHSNAPSSPERRASPGPSRTFRDGQTDKLESSRKAYDETSWASNRSHQGVRFAINNRYYSDDEETEDSQDTWSSAGLESGPLFEATIPFFHWQSRSRMASESTEAVDEDMMRILDRIDQSLSAAKIGRYYDTIPECSIQDLFTRQEFLNGIMPIGELKPTRGDDHAPSSSTPHDSSLKIGEKAEGATRRAETQEAEEEQAKSTGMEGLPQVKKLMKELVDISRQLTWAFLPKQGESTIHTLLKRFWGSVDTMCRQVMWEEHKSAPEEGCAYFIRDFSAQFSPTDTGNGAEPSREANSPRRLSWKDCMECKTGKHYASAREALEHLHVQHLHCARGSEWPFDDPCYAWLHQIWHIPYQHRELRDGLLFHMERFIDGLCILNQYLKALHVMVSNSIADAGSGTRPPLPSALLYAFEKMTTIFVLRSKILSLINRRRSVSLDNWLDGKGPLWRRIEAKIDELEELEKNEMNQVLKHLNRAKRDIFLSGNSSYDIESLQPQTVGAEFLAMAIICAGQNMPLKSAQPAWRYQEDSFIALYKDYTSRLHYRANRRPQKRVFLDVRDLEEELEALRKLLLNQYSSLVLYGNVLNPETLRMVAKSRIGQNETERAYHKGQLLRLKERMREIDNLEMRCKLLKEQVRQTIEVMEEGHGKAIRVFTIVTLLFLPLSFVSSFLGMNTRDVRDMDFDQRLFWICAIPVTVVVVGLASIYGYKGDEIYDWIRDLGLMERLAGRDTRSMSTSKVGAGRQGWAGMGSYAEVAAPRGEPRLWMADPKMPVRRQTTMDSLAPLSSR